MPCLQKCIFVLQPEIISDYFKKHQLNFSEKKTKHPAAMPQSFQAERKIDINEKSICSLSPLDISNINLARNLKIYIKMIGTIKNMRKFSTYTNLEKKEKNQQKAEISTQEDEDFLLENFKEEKFKSEFQKYCKKLKRTLSVKF